MQTRFLLLLILSLGIGLSVPFFLGGGAALSLLGNLSPSATGFLAILVVSTWLFNAYRVFLLLKKEAEELSFRKAFALILACDFSVRATPLGIGGPVTAIAVLKQISIQPTTTIAAFSLLFVLDLVLVLGLSFILYAISLYEWILADQVSSLALLVFISSLILIALIKLPDYYRKPAIYFGQLLGTVPVGRHFRYPLARQFVMVKKGWQKFLFLPISTRILIAVGSAAFWLTQFSLLYTCLQLLGADIGWTMVAAIQFLAMGAGRLTMLPAGSGGLEAVAIGLLLLWIDPTIAAAGVLLWRSITLFPSLAAGGVAMLVLGIKLKIAKSAFPEKPSSYLH